jgi:Uma2 family endonuclease
MDLNERKRRQGQRAYRQYIADITSLERREVVPGEPAPEPFRSGQDGAIAFGASFLIDSHLRHRQQGGKTFRPAPAFLLQHNPTLIRVPDLAFVAGHRLDDLDWTAPLVEAAPDLVVEVVTDPCRQEEVLGRIFDFFRAGTRMAWLLDGKAHEVSVMHAKRGTHVFRDHERVRAAPLLPWFNVPASEFFGG